MCRSARERTEPLPIRTRHVPPLCHSDRSVSGVEESTTWEKVPTPKSVGDHRQLFGVVVQHFAAGFGDEYQVFNAHADALLG